MQKICNKLGIKYRQIKLNNFILNNSSIKTINYVSESILIFALYVIDLELAFHRIKMSQIKLQ